MSLRAPRPAGRWLAAGAAAVGVLALAALVGVLVAAVTHGERPEEDVALAYVEALYSGDGAAAHDLLTPGVRAVVFEADLEALAEAASGLAGPEPELEIVGAERSGTRDPLESFVGYRGQGRVGTLRGVVTLVELESGRWRVREASYRFPDASEAETADLRAVSRALNEQIAERLGAAEPAP